MDWPTLSGWVDISKLSLIHPLDQSQVKLTDAPKHVLIFSKMA